MTAPVQILISQIGFDVFGLSLANVKCFIFPSFESVCVCGLMFVQQDSADKRLQYRVLMQSLHVKNTSIPTQVCINTIISEDPLQAIYDLQILKAWMHHILNYILFHSSTNTNPCLSCSCSCSVPIATNISGDFNGP